MKPNALVMGTYYFSGHTIGKRVDFGPDKYQVHLDRVQHMKGAIDNNCPKTFRHSVVNAKRQRSLQERQAKIDFENRLLLDKLARIVHRKPELIVTTIKPGRRTKNPYEEMREKDARRIERENGLIVNRIRSVSAKSTYDRAKMLKDSAENDAHVRRLAHYAPPQYPSRPHSVVPFLQKYVPSLRPYSSPAAVQRHTTPAASSHKEQPSSRNSTIESQQDSMAAKKKAVRIVSAQPPQKSASPKRPATASNNSSTSRPKSAK